MHRACWDSCWAEPYSPPVRLIAVLLALALAAGCTGGVGGSGPVEPEDRAVLGPGDAFDGEIGGFGGQRRSHLVRVGEGQAVEILVDRLDGGLDPYLRVYDEAGVLLAEDDDGGGRLNSLATVQVTSAAVVTAEVGSFNDGSTGPYRLRVTATTADRLPPPDPRQVILTRIGEIDEAGTPVRYPFDGTAGRTIAISVAALDVQLDPVVALLDPDGVQIGRDDDGADRGRDSLLELRLATTGTHVAVVTPFSAGGRNVGQFRITITSGSRPGELEGPPPSTPKPLRTPGEVPTSPGQVQPTGE